MTQTAELRCACGEVEGRVTDASPRSVNRLVCYCDDCQAFLHRLGRTDLFLDAHGGSDIVQVAPASLAFVRGKARIEGLRLKKHGLYRFYASCCRSPVGNTVGPAVPFVGILASAFTAPDAAFGPPTGAILGKFAVGDAPPGSKDLNLRILGRAVRHILGWKLGGRTWPHPFFERATKQPLPPVIVLTEEERDALRPLCGPVPARR